MMTNQNDISMMRVGFVGLDTSHPASFVKILSEMKDVQVCAVHDKNTVRDEKYIDDFCATNNCRRFDSLQEMAKNVDAAMILGVNWDWHFAQSEPFLRAGKAVYVDKPLCGNIADIARFDALIKETGAPFLAGSGWRFNTKVLSAAEKCIQSDVTDIYVESCLPAYFYGVHAVELAIGLLGHGFTKVHTTCWDEEKAGLLFTLEHNSGKHVLVKIAPSQQYWRGALFRHGDEWQKVTFDAEDIHGSVCATFVEMARNRKSPYSFESCSESVRIMLAALHSHQRGSDVSICDVIPEEVNFDGSHFLANYRKR